VDLSVYDLMGREVRRLVAEKQSAGQHSVVWNCLDLHGNRAARGVYFIRLDTPGFRSVKKAGGGALARENGEPRVENSRTRAGAGESPPLRLSRTAWAVGFRP